MNNMNNKSQPFLRWAGSKRKLLPKLKPYWRNYHRRYIEPFMGSACLFFDIEPNAAILSDINKDLINTYVALKDFPREVYDATKVIENNKDSYYLTRSLDPETLDPITRAARFIFLNRYCFNGLYRTNKKGQFNVPYNFKRIALPHYELFESCSKSLKNAQILCADFEYIVSESVSENDLVYLDPPYAIKNKRIFTQYDAFSFGINDLERLTRLLDLIVKRKADFVLSYAESEEAYEFFKNWNYELVSTQRNISGFASHRKVENELIISSIKI